MYILRSISGVDPGFQVRGGGLKKIAPCGGRIENFWGILCEKSRFYAKKIYFFQFYGGGTPGSVPGPSIQKLINIDRRKLVEILVLILTK
jgi:hypothetical protein